MGIDAEDILVCLLRILQFVIKTSYRFGQKHPLVVGFFLFPYLLYIFFPFILSFLVFASPFLLCVAVLLRLFWTSEQSRIVDGDDDRKNGIVRKKSRSVEYDVVVTPLQNRTCSRGNVEGKNKELDLQTGKMDEQMVLQAASNEDPTGKTAIEEKESYSFEHGESSSARAFENLEEHRPFLAAEPSNYEIVSRNGTEQNHKFGIIEIEAENQEEADDDDEEEAQEDGNKAMEWTEDDQKNLLDLGISEIERNRRLESLIARRRAKKSLKLQVDRDLVDSDSNSTSQVAPIFVARNSPIDVPRILDEIEKLEMPDSAPSILLPTRNPFDLPYDPLEEKPNLMGDSFHQEFTAAQKEMLFCRHESFSLGPSFPVESKHDGRDTKFISPFFTEMGPLGGPGYSRFKRLSDNRDHDSLMEHLLHEEGNRRASRVETGTQAHNQVINSVEGSHGMESLSSNKREVDMEALLGEDSSDDSDSYSSSEESEVMINAYRAVASENVESEAAQRSIGISTAEPETEPLYDSSSSANGKNSGETSSNFAGKGSCHTSTNSIASDLQVEVSEAGSPPLTVDGTTSPTEGESMYDEDIDKEITSVRKENESKSRGIYAFNQEHIMEVGSSGANKNSKGVVVPFKRPDQVDDQETTDTGSLSSSTIDISGESQAPSINIDHKIHADVEQAVEKVGDQSKSSKSADPSSSENLKREMHLMEKLMAYSLLETPEESSGPSGKSTEETITVDNLRENKVNETNNMKFIQESVDKRSTIAINQISDDPIESASPLELMIEEVPINSSSPSSSNSLLAEKITIDQASSSNSSQNLENGAETNAVDEQPPLDLQRKEAFDLLEKFAEGTSTINNLKEPMVHEAKDSLESSEETVDELSTIISRGAVENQSSDDAIASALSQELVIEEVPINSSSSSSPTSVLAEKIPLDQASSSISSPNLDTDSLDEQPPLNFTLTAPRNAQLMGEDNAHPTEKIPLDQASSSTSSPNLDTDSLDEQPPLNFTLTAPQNAQLMVEDNAHPTKSGVFENFLEPSIPTEKSTEETNTVDKLREPMVNDDEVKDNSRSNQAIEWGFQTQASHKASSDLSEPVQDNNNIPGTMEPRKFTIEDDTVYGVNDPVVSEVEDKEKFTSVEKSEVESQSLTEQAIVLEPLAPGEETSLEFIEDVNQKLKEMTEGEALPDPGKSSANTESSRTKDTRQLIEHDNISHLPNSSYTASSLEGEENEGTECESLTESEAVDSSKTAVERRYHDGSENIKEQEPWNSLEKFTVEAKIVDNVRGSPVNEGKNNLKPTQESVDEQNIITSGASELNQNSDGSIASASPQESATEVVPINSSSPSSPTSVLPEKISADQASSSNSSQNLESTAKADTLDEKLSPNLTQAAPQNVQHIMEDKNAYQTKNDGFANLLEPSIPTSAEETNIVDNLREPMVNDQEGKQNPKSHQAVEGESERCISLNASTARPEPAKDSTHIKEPRMFTTEANTVYSVNDPVVSRVEDEERFTSVEKIEGESQSLNKQAIILEPLAPGEETSSELKEGVDEKSREMTEGKAHPDPLISFDKIENSRTKEETEDSGKPSEHDNIVHLPKSSYTLSNQEGTENAGAECHNLTESEAVDPSKTAVEKRNLVASVQEEPSHHL